MSDDGAEFTNLSALSFDHRPVPRCGKRAKMDSCLPLISRVTANLQPWIDGAFHDVLKPPLQGHLNEYLFRFNRRCFRAVLIWNLRRLGTLHAWLNLPRGLRCARKPMSHELTGVRARVRCLNGKISIDRKPGEGTLSRVELPALDLGRARAS